MPYNEQNEIACDFFCDAEACILDMLMAGTNETTIADLLTKKLIKLYKPRVKVDSRSLEHVSFEGMTFHQKVQYIADQSIAKDLAAKQDQLPPEFWESASSAVQDAIKYVVKKYERFRASFADDLRIGRPRVLKEADLFFLRRMLGRVPADYGYEANLFPGWTVACIRDCLWRWAEIVVSDATIRRVLERIGYKWDGTTYSHSWPSTPALISNRFSIDPALRTPIVKQMGEAASAVVHELKILILDIDATNQHEQDLKRMVSRKPFERGSV